MEIKLQHKNIPSFPGVYFFRNSRAAIVYIGKAANLKARLRSYFSKTPHAPKTTAMLAEARSLSWEVVGSEIEALIRESELIKKHRPKYNVLMRDDKNYFYIGFTREQFPKVFVTHHPQQASRGERQETRKNFGAFRLTLDAHFLGPFTEGGVLRSALKTLRRTLPYCTCKAAHKTPCLNSRIGRCLGFCCTHEVRQQLMSLRTDSDALSAWSPSPPTGGRGAKGLKSSEPRAGAARMSEETALVAAAEKQYQKNIAAIKKILSGKNKSLVKNLKKEMKKLSGTQHYEEAGKIRDQINALEKIFEHHGVVRSDLPSDRQKTLRALTSLLKLKQIHRIEGYDIANIQGKFAYGSMVVFIDGMPAKNLYRIFKIRSGNTSDDPGMLREVLTRRLGHREWALPDVVLIDGGKAQLNTIQHALYVLSSWHSVYGLGHMEIIALTKNERHIGDRLLIAGQKDPLALSSLPPPLANLLRHIDAEAHRFAIKHYRKSHRKIIS